MPASPIVTVDLSGFTTDAKFRTWSQAVHDALVLSGLTQTADTGQINHTTVLRPVTANTQAGYEIWRFNDALQATAPIFFRLAYGSNGHASGQNPGTWLTVGTGSDGAGNITGVGLPLTQTSTSTTASSNVTSQVGAAYSTSASSVSILGGIGPVPGVYHAALWQISRTCSSSGAPTSIGVLVTHPISSSIASPRQRGAAFSPAVQYGQNTVGIGPPIGSVSTSGGGNVQLFRQYGILGVLQPTLGCLAYFTTDIVTFTMFSAAAFGSTTHNYIALGGGIATGFETSSSITNIVPAFIWE